MSIHLSVSNLVQHLIFLFVVLVTPVWDYRDTQRLKQNPDSPHRISYYKTVCSWLWISTVFACLAVGLRPLLVISPASSDAAWLFHLRWIRFALWAAIILLIAVVVLPYGSVAWRKIAGKPRTYKSSDLFQKVSYAYLFPGTWTERRWWLLVGITAGVCEEIVFRGFLLHYLHHSPLQLTLTLAIVISSVIFGLQHLYQGLSGSVGATLVGALLAFLFVLTGSLVYPILLHAAMDLRLLVILRPPAEQST